MSDGSHLTAEELRVLACMIEKSHTTPDQYPLSSNALTNACNQKSSREPVVDYTTQQVDETLQLLRDAGWVRMIRGKGNRTFKHRHVIDEKLGLSVPQQSVVAVLALRGPQSPGELKTRTDRYHPFADLDEVEAVLATLAGREQPLVRNVGRASGQSQDRWVQLLGEAGEGVSTAVSVIDAPGVPAGTGSSVTQEQRSPIIEAVPTASWTGDSFRKLADDGLDVVHAAIGPSSTFRDLVWSIEQWNGWFAAQREHIVRGRGGIDVREAMATGRTVVMLSAVDPTPIEDDPGLVEICHLLGLRFLAIAGGADSSMVHSQNGEFASRGGGKLTSFGAEVLAEMNRIGLVAELAGCGPQVILDVVDRAFEPPVITGCIRPGGEMMTSPCPTRRLPPSAKQAV